jgi:hypothetical protein
MPPVLLLPASYAGEAIVHLFCSIFAKVTRNPLVGTLAHLKGNPRAAVWTEPMWGLSMALVLPYLSVFMVPELGKSYLSAAPRNLAVARPTIR